jgi:cytochrome c biogenesis protein CcdA
MSDLTYAEVKIRLNSYSDTAITDELYSSGESLVSNAADRMAKLDSKALGLAAYSAGIVTMLISTSAMWTKLLSGRFFSAVAACSVFALVVAAWLSIRSTFSQPIQWYTVNNWLDNQCLENREKLRRYRVLTMAKILDSYFAAIRIKNRRMKTAVRVMYFALGLLVLCLLQVSGLYAFLQRLCLWIR